MVWCSQCSMEVEVEADDAHGFSCCVQCGRVVEDTAFSSDVMFNKGADGEGELVGQMVGASGEARGVARFSGGRMWASRGDGHEAAVSRGRYEICALVEALRISPSSEATEAAHRLYKLALQRGFTKGRRVNQVAAICLYIFCRLEKRPYMLIDFSDQLSVNVYTLGGVFLQMLRLLRLDEHATFTKPIDPSLFMNRFVDRLRLPTPELKTKVGNTAMRLVQSMKRDWMLTGRRPSGICGAALFLAAHIHGVEKTKRDIIGIVHIGWGTVEKRVMELAETRDAELTLKELDERDKAAEEQREQMLLEYHEAAEEAAAAAAAAAEPRQDGGGGGGSGAQVVQTDAGASGQYCEHVRAGTPLLAHGMCRGCLEEYLKVTMAVREGAYDPPAYLRNLRRDVRKRVREKLVGEQPMLALRGSTEVLALEAAPPDDDAEEPDGVHQRRHAENEAALEACARQEQGPEEQQRDGAAGPSGSSGPGAGMMGPEEEEFDTALRSSEMQPLARALEGVAPAVASALSQPRRAAAAASAAEAEAAADLGAGDAGTSTGGAAGDGTLCASGNEPAAEGEEQAGSKRARLGDASTQAIIGVAGGDTDADAAIAAAAAAFGGGAVVPGGDDGEGEGPDASGSGTSSEDNLSDVDDEEITGYLASREEATMREQLWTELNKDWIEKQEAKRVDAEDPVKAAERAKRKNTRKPKAALPAAEDAAGATRNLLAAKKLSNKINYGALEDLFGGGDNPAGPSGGAPRRSASPDFVGGASEGRGGGGGDWDADGAGASGNGAAAALPGGSGSGLERGDGEGSARPAVVAALEKRAAGRERAKAADADRYAGALEEETRRRGSLGGGGGFLGSLTFARGQGEGGAGGRMRPQSLLGPKPRGR